MANLTIIYSACLQFRICTAMTALNYHISLQYSMSPENNFSLFPHLAQPRGILCRKRENYTSNSVLFEDRTVGNGEKRTLNIIFLNEELSQIKFMQNCSAFLTLPQD